MFFRSPSQEEEETCSPICESIVIFPEALLSAGLFLKRWQTVLRNTDARVGRIDLAEFKATY